ncbi:MAG: chemotaxis protein CheX [Anaerolineales bacterium]|nr:chemotaxis protein CheX [Anaerolineales bacterium]
MRTDIFNAFIVAAGEVLVSEANLQITRGPLTLERDAYVTKDVSVLISLVGDVWGIAVISLSFETAKAITARILDQEMTDFNELAQSGIGELGNVVVGRASTRLAEQGYRTDISVPTLIVGKGSRISTLGIDRLIVPLETELGIIRLDLALKGINAASEASQANTSASANGTVPIRQR